MNRPEWLWGLGFVALALFGYGFIPTPRVREPVDSFSEESGGKKAFFLLTEALLSRVERSSGSLVPDDDSADTLVMLGPARYPDRAQWQTLYDWVSGGHALVFAARHRDPAVALEPFGLEIVPESDPLDGRADESSDERTGLVTDLVDAPVAWQSEAQVRAVPPMGSEKSTMEVELSVDGAPQVVWKPIGDGAIVVVASDDIFTNRSLTKDYRGLLAFRILETASPSGPIYFDEEMNQAGAPKVVGVLFEEPFRLLTFQLLVATFLYGWKVSRRFGPKRNRTSTPRRSLVEHAKALGALHFRVGTGSPLLSAYLELFRRDLGLRVSGRGRRVELDQRLSREDTVLAQAVRASKRPDLDRGSVAHLVKRLAQFRRDPDGRPQGPAPSSGPEIG